MAGTTKTLPDGQHSLYKPRDLKSAEASIDLLLDAIQKEAREADSANDQRSIKILIAVVELYRECLQLGQAVPLKAVLQRADCSEISGRHWESAMLWFEHYVLPRLKSAARRTSALRVLYPIRAGTGGGFPAFHSATFYLSLDPTQRDRKPRQSP